MFNFKKKQKITNKEIIKKINYQLTSNFFSVEEFIELSTKQAYKVIKLISKLNNIKLKRTEIKSIVIEIQSINIELKKIDIKQTNVISKLFNWSLALITKEVVNTSSVIIKVISYIFIFRLDRKKIIRI